LWPSPFDPAMMTRADGAICMTLELVEQAGRSGPK